MRGSGVTAARSCLQPLVSASRYLAVHALPGDPLYFVVEAKSRVKEVYAQTCVLLGQQGMRDCELFGLAILSDGEYLFVDSESKLSKYAPKNWRSSHTYGLDSSGRPAFVLYFRVRYYIDTPLLLSDETTRHHYYLQLRDNVVRHGGGVESLHPHHPLHATTIAAPLLALAGLALQADLGDYAEERHRPHAGSVGYCKPTDYLPPHMCLDSNVLSVLASQHRDNHGLSREEAELQYIQDTVMLEAPLNAHLYRLRRNKSEAGPGRILLAICARGVRVYTEEATPRVFAWNNIGKLCFDRKKFEIRAVDQPDKLTLYSGCDDKSKLLLGLCRDTHQFSMAIAPRVTEAKRREEEERKVLRECYMYPARCKLSMTGRGARGDQRISVISTTSSNTTSGIVSDRVHSEDDADIGPASTECLPQLTESSGRGSNNQINGNSDDRHDGKTMSRSISPVSTVDEVDGVDATPSTTIPTRQNVNLTIATEGSQCSSSCSTVVVVNQPTNQHTHRSGRASATSSLELGYSHTAQNSAVSSEAASFPGAIYDRCKKTSNYADAPLRLNVDDAATDMASETSGIYTLRSSAIQDETTIESYSSTADTNGSSVASDVCAVSSVQSTTDEASVTSGFYTINSGLRSSTSDSVYTIDPTDDDTEEPIYSICKGDEDDDEDDEEDDDEEDEDDSPHDLSQTANMMIQNDSRSRSNSVTSAGSFRGDGSDPSNIGPLLSADELTDLIVGRYPPRKTVSTSMDSDCDYVTMPPPPPPPRTDSNNDRQQPPPPPYPSNANYPKIRNPRPTIAPPTVRDNFLPPPPPYPSSRSDLAGLPPRRLEPPPPPAYASPPRERIKIPPPTPPRNDAITPREPPPPPPYPEIMGPGKREAIAKLYPPPPDSKSTIVSRSAHGNDIPERFSDALSLSANETGPPAPKPPPRIQPPTYPGDKMKPTPVHAPVAALVVGPNNYLDVHASRGGSISRVNKMAAAHASAAPPPVTHNRQPPPPPPPNALATVYTSQIARSQIEQYRQQLYSDVDFVVFPLKDPALSKQDYIDAKQGSVMAAMAAAYPPPPPYPDCSDRASSVVYRSTPYLPGSSFSSICKYASNRNLSDATFGNCGISGDNLNGGHYAASTSSLYSGATCSSSVGSHSLGREPPVPVHPQAFGGFGRTRSDENILKCFDSGITQGMETSNGIVGQSIRQTKHRRLPPPPPPPPYEIQNLEINQPLPSASCSTASQSKKQPSRQSMMGTESKDDDKDDGMLDIRTLREKSRNLDLPLISALCNDRYLLKQTKAFVLPKHPSETSMTTSVGSKTATRSGNVGNSLSSRNKYPVSGLSTNQISKSSRKSSTSTHRHPSETRSGNACKLTTTNTNNSNATATTLGLSSPARKDPTRASHS